MKKIKNGRRAVFSCDRDINPFTKYILSILLLIKSKLGKLGKWIADY